MSHSRLNSQFTHFSFFHLRHTSKDKTRKNTKRQKSIVRGMTVEDAPSDIQESTTSNTNTNTNTETTETTNAIEEINLCTTYQSTRPPFLLLSDTYDIFSCENWIQPDTTDDLDLENLPEFNIELSELSELELPSIDLSDLDFSFLESTITTDSTDSTDSTDPATESTENTNFEPCLLPNDFESFDSFIHNYNCGYCGRPAGWRSNTQHFVQLRSGTRYACFACLRARWQQRTIYHKPKTRSESKSQSRPRRDASTKNHHRRLPRRRILNQP